MSSINKRPDSSVANWSPSSNKFTPLTQQSIVAPYGLTLRQVLTSSGSVTIPAGITFVYAIVVGGGGSNAGGGGGVASGAAGGPGGSGIVIIRYF